MAAGIPMVTTQEGGIADFLFDAKRNPDKQPTGWAVDKEDPEQVAAAVTYIMDNPDEAKQVVENAQTLVREKYNWDQIVRDMEEQIFSQVLK